MKKENTNIVDKELEARREALAQILKIHGYDVTREADMLKIKHKDGYTKDAYFSRSKLNDAFVKAGTEHLTQKMSQATLSDKELKEVYTKAGKLALEESRSGFCYYYLLSIQKERRMQQLEQSKSSDSPTLSK